MMLRGARNAVNETGRTAARIETHIDKPFHRRKIRFCEFSYGLNNPFPRTDSCVAGFHVGRAVARHSLTWLRGKAGAKAAVAVASNAKKDCRLSVG